MLLIIRAIAIIAKMDTAKQASIIRSIPLLAELVSEQLHAKADTDAEAFAFIVLLVIAKEEKSAKPIL